MWWACIQTTGHSHLWMKFRACQETHALMAFQRSLAMDACGGSNAQDELDNVSRVNKRCRVWLRLLSDHAQLSSALPMTCLALPNFLDSKLNKRPWERKMRDARMLLRMLSEGDTEALYRFYHARFPQTTANHEWLPIMLPDARQTLRQSLEDWQTEVLRVWILSLLLDADDDKLRDDVCGGCEQELASHFDLVMHILATSDACISPTANHVIHPWFDSWGLASHRVDWPEQTTWISLSVFTSELRFTYLCCVNGLAWFGCFQVR